MSQDYATHDFTDFVIDFSTLYIFSSNLVHYTYLVIITVEAYDDSSNMHFVTESVSQEVDMERRLSPDTERKLQGKTASPLQLILIQHISALTYLFRIFPYESTTPDSFMKKSCYLI